MSRDFAPCHHWAANLMYPDLYFSNIKMCFAGKEEWIYTEEELADRKTHPYIAVMGTDIYKTLREKLSEDRFKELNKALGELADADTNHRDTSRFPAEMVDWYYNRHGHYYHEPNDEEFLEYILTTIKEKR